MSAKAWLLKWWPEIVSVVLVVGLSIWVFLNRDSITLVGNITVSR